MTLEKALSGSVDTTLGREAEMRVWNVLAEPSFLLGLAATRGLVQRLKGCRVCCGVQQSPLPIQRTDGESALGVSSWKLKWPDSDSETTEVLEADGFL